MFKRGDSMGERERERMVTRSEEEGGGGGCRIGKDGDRVECGEG